MAAALTAFSVIAAPAANADPTANDWARVRACESSNNYSINTGTGYYGAYQFNQDTWLSVGGAGRPDLNSAAEQDYRALYLYRMRGWQPWTCGAGLSEDADARSKRVPSYAESKYIGAGTAPGTPVTTTPGTNDPRPASILDAFLPPAGSGMLVEPALPAFTFSAGSCSPVVALWQQQMNRFGYGFDATGCFSSKTRTAAQDLQYANGIKVTNDIGPLTLIAAYLGRAPK